MTTAVSFLQQQGDSINVLLIAVKRPDVWDEKRLSILVYRDNSMQANTRPTTGHNIYLSIYLSVCPSIRLSVHTHTHHTDMDYPCLPHRQSGLKVILATITDI